MVPPAAAPCVPKHVREWYLSGHMDDLGSLKSQPPGYAFETVQYDLFQVIFVASGELAFVGRDTVPYSTRLLHPGDIAVLRLGSSFSLSSPEHGYGGICYRDFAPEDSRQRGPSWSCRADEWLIELIGSMQFALAHPDTCSQETVTLLARTIAWHAVETRESDTQPDGSSDSARWTAQIKQVIRHTLYATPETCRNGLDLLGLSYRQLSRHFLRTTGTTIKQFQIAERIREAKRLLRSTGMTITDIAFELHYPSSQKFAAQFKTVTGTTPRAYRAHHRYGD